MNKYILALGLILTSTMATANVVGVDTQNFNPITSGLDFVTVQSSETLEPGVVNFGFFLNYASNTLPSFGTTGTSTGSRTKSLDRLLSSDFNIGVGLMKNWDAGISFPAVVNQEVETQQFKGYFDKSGLTDVRLNTKVRVYGDKDGGVAFVGTVEFPQVENNPFYGSGGGPTYNLEIAGDTTYNKVALGANLGYRVRNPGTQINNIIAPIDDMYIASVAGSYLFESIDTKLISEIFTSFPIKDSATQTAKELSSQEWLVGLKHDMTTDLAVHAGVSTELGQGTASPDWRVYAGLNWTMGPLWGKEEPVEVVQAVPQEIPPPPSAPPTEEPVIAPMTTMTTDAEQETFPESRVPEKREVFIVKNINFSTASNKIPQKFKNYLKKISKYLMKDPPFQRMVISGHTDSVGPADYNRKLSEARAATTKRAFVELYGLPANRIEVEGFGEDKPIADNGNYQGRARNRRVEFYIER